MRIGVPREIKDGERRVGVTPEGARRLVADGHAVVVGRRRGCGRRIFRRRVSRGRRGDRLVADAVWSCELIVKVKELQPAEFRHLVAGTTVFGFAQLNRDPALLAAVLAARIQVIAYETVRDAAGGLPLLAPMSRIAGRLAPFVGGAGARDRPRRRRACC